MLNVDRGRSSCAIDAVLQDSPRQNPRARAVDWRDRMAKGTTMFERFTDRARRTMALANRHAQRLNHTHIDAPHMLLGLLEEGSGVAMSALRSLNLDIRQAIRAAEAAAGPPGPTVVTLGKLPQTVPAKRIIEQAIEVARSLGHTYVGTEHICLAMLRDPAGVGVQVLGQQGVTFEGLRDEVVRQLGPSPTPESLPPGESAPGRAAGTPAWNVVALVLLALAVGWLVWRELTRP